MNNLVADGATIQYVNSGSAVVSGGMVDIGGRIGIAVKAIATDETEALNLAGVYKLTRLADETGAVAQGDVVYKDAATNTWTSVADPGLTPIGVAHVAIGSSDTEGKIRLVDFGPGAALSDFLKIKRIVIDADATGATDTGWAIPAKASVIDVFLDVVTGDVGETMDVGVFGGDADGFLDGASIGTAGIVRGAFAKTTGGNNDYLAAIGASHTIGTLLGTVLVAGENITAGGDGHAQYNPADGNGGDNIGYTPSGSPSTMRGSIYVVYLELP